MNRLSRAIPGLLGKLLVGTTFVTRAFGDAVMDAEEVGLFLAPANVPDPQVRLAGAIMLLFAGSLSILAVGYVVDSTRDGE
jgi:putative oxidoreductase